MNSGLSSVIGVAALIGLAGCPRSKPDPAKPDLETDLAIANPPLEVKPNGTNEAAIARLHVIDIGQGLSVLLEFPCGLMLYDTGGEENGDYSSLPVLTAYLDKVFARRPELKNTIDLLAISHPHIDHTRGIAEVLERYNIRNVIDNGDDIDDLGGAPQMALHAWVAAQDDRVPYEGIKRGNITSREGLTNETIDPIGGSCAAGGPDPMIRALWGGTDRPQEMGGNANNDSVVLRVDYGATSFLLAGDLEIAGWAKMTKKLGERNPIFDVDVYLVGHHGSKNATVPYQVELMSPKIAVISAGPYSRYLRTEEEFTAHVFAHPNAKALEPLLDEGYGVSMFRAKPIRAWVGLKGRWKESLAVWEQRIIRRAIYATSWDGSVIVNGYDNGFISVDVELADTKWVPPLVEGTKP